LLYSLSKAPLNGHLSCISGSNPKKTKKIITITITIVIAMEMEVTIVMVMEVSSLIELSE